MDGAQNGYLVAIRELPGFLLIFVAAALLRLGMARATAVSLATMGVGYALYGASNSFQQIIIPTRPKSVSKTGRLSPGLRCQRTSSVGVRWTL